jgi:hypothetical protein
MALFLGRKVSTIYEIFREHCIYWKKLCKYAKTSSNLADKW